MKASKDKKKEESMIDKSEQIKRELPKKDIPLGIQQKL